MAISMDDNLRPQHNYGASQYFVKHRLRMLIYTNKLRVFACFDFILALIDTLSEVSPYLSELC